MALLLRFRSGRVGRAVVREKPPATTPVVFVNFVYDDMNSLFDSPTYLNQGASEALYQRALLFARAPSLQTHMNDRHRV
jgi:hypothetical protein